MSETEQEETPREDQSLDQIIEEIEGKLEALDERRRDLDHKIELKRARVREINETIQNLEEIEANINQPGES